MIARRFHHALAHAVAGLALILAKRNCAGAIALSDGAFHNRLLLEGVLAALAPSGLRLLAHRQLPSGDGGLALGQAAIAAPRLPST